MFVKGFVLYHLIERDLKNFVVSTIKDVYFVTGENLRVVVFLVSKNIFETVPWSCSISALCAWCQWGQVLMTFDPSSMYPVPFGARLGVHTLLYV